MQVQSKPTKTTKKNREFGGVLGCSNTKYLNIALCSLMSTCCFLVLLSIGLHFAFDFLKTKGVLIILCILHDLILPPVLAKLSSSSVGTHTLTVLWSKRKIQKKNHLLPSIPESARGRSNASRSGFGQRCCSLDVCSSSDPTHS